MSKSKKGFAIIIVPLISIILTIIVVVVLVSVDDANTPNSGEVEQNKLETTDLENTLSDIPRKDAEDIIKNFQYSTSNMSVHYYKNGNALKKIIALQSEIAGDGNPLEKWSDQVLQTRAKIVRAYLPMLEIRLDKVQLKKKLDYMISKNIPNDSRYSAEDIAIYNDLAEKTESLLNNLDANEDKVIALKNEINAFIIKYD